MTVLASSDKKASPVKLDKAGGLGYNEDTKGRCRETVSPKTESILYYANRSGAAGRLARFWGKVYHDREDHDDTHQHSQDSRPTSATHPLSPPFAREWLTAYVPRQRPPLSGLFHPNTRDKPCQFPPPFSRGGLLHYEHSRQLCWRLCSLPKNTELQIPQRKRKLALNVFCPAFLQKSGRVQGGALAGRGAAPHIPSVYQIPTGSPAAYSRAALPARHR